MLEPPNSAADLSAEQGKECLTLSTVHSAKGLEWPVVFVIWVMEGYFPPARAGDNEAALEEERRLLYVAATRAKDRLMLCYPGQETGRAWFASEAKGLSSFLQALPSEVAEYCSSSRWGKIMSPWGRPIPARRADKGFRPVADQPTGLRAGDRVRHPAFGQGVISKLVGDEKVEVLFRDVGRKLLHLGYTSLEKV
jgi:DNA helicase-2/ATP-dependent DNA helicase PcrA